MSRVLVLGGTRFVGRAIVDRLVLDHTVTVANRGTVPLWDERIRQVHVDRNDPERCREGLTGGYDVVVDVSGTSPHHVASVLGTPAVRNASSYVYISSAAVYDRKVGTPPFGETDPVGGDEVWGEYGRDKDRCEKALLHGFAGDVTVLRPPYVYGPFNGEDREQFLWARMLSGQPIFVPGAGDTRLQFCHVDQLAAVVAQACSATLPSGTYNVGEQSTYSVTEYVRILSDVCGASPRLVHVHDTAVRARDYFPFRDVDLTLDTARLAHATATTDVPLRTGLRTTFDWCVDHDTIVDRPTPTEVTWRAQ